MSDQPEKDPPRFTLSYTPELDGLRGIAVGLVVLHHCANRFFPGGYVGVDVFFVLSGFLITQLLIQELAGTGRINFKNFYLRRALRLGPALIVVLAALLLYNLLFQSSTVLKESLWESLIVLFYVANWVIAFGLYPLHSMQHSWSLSIEEQYYILWPVALLFLYRYARSGKQLLCFGLFGVVAVVLWRTALTLNGATVERLYNGLDTRLDSLLIGCCLAFFLSYSSFRLEDHPRLLRWLELAASLALVAIVGLSLSMHWHSKHLYYWGFVFLEIASALLVLNVFVNHKSILNRLLRFWPLTWVGTLSYGLYLWHYPVMKLWRETSIASHISMPLAVITSLVLCSLSYYLIEKPLLRYKKRFR